jgi:hypothetical protein
MCDAEQHLVFLRLLVCVFSRFYSSLHSIISSLLLLLLEDYILLLSLHKARLLICRWLRVNNGNLIIKNGNLIRTPQNCLCLCLPPANEREEDRSLVLSFSPFSCF